MQLQQSVDDLKARGLGLAAISYDSPTTLKAFAGQRGITFPLLSDAGSATIKRYGILNAEATGRTAGIPYPGTFVLDARGTVVSRAFEDAYQERATAGSVLARVDRVAAGPAEAGHRSVSSGTSVVETQHLTARTSASDATAGPGTRFSLFIDIVPKPKMHVYAPEQKDYIPVSIRLRDDPAFRVHAPAFPKAEKYFFAPLKETQLVYSKPFRIVQDLTVALTPAVREQARTAGATLTIGGTLRYQACDDAICYLPKELPVSWTVALRALER